MLKKKQKPTKILITGSQNYQNKSKIFNTLNLIQTDLIVGTFNCRQGAQFLTYKYSIFREIPIKYFSIKVFSDMGYNYYKSQHLMLESAVRWSNLILIFSNVYTNKIKNIEKIAKKYNKKIIFLK